MSNKIPCGGFKLDNNFLGMNENDELSLTGGSEGEGKPYQQLVTDGTGNTKWEDRLAYETVEFVEAIAEQSVEFDYFEEENSGEMLNFIDISSYTNLITDDTKVKVVFDGVEYFGKLTLYMDTEIGEDYFFGNGYLVDPGLPDTGESFCVNISVEGTEHARVRVYCNVPGNTHTFGLNIGKSDVHTISQKYIPAVTKLTMLSSTHNSTKKFEITVNDYGTISANEISTGDVPQ